MGQPVTVHTIDHDRSLTGAETIAISLVSAPVVIVVLSYLLDRIGAPIWPRAYLVLSVSVAAGTLAVLAPRSRWRWPEIAAFAASVAAPFAWLLWIAAPAYLPLGAGSDLTHHLLLIEYIEQHWRLVHDPDAYRFLGEMASYTPGSHVLTALAGNWTSLGGAHVLHAVVSGTVALKLGFLFLIAQRGVEAIYPGTGRRHDGICAALALLAVLLAFSSRSYLLGSFVDASFIAQVVAELFAVVMWWAATTWTVVPVLSVVVFGAAGCATFLTWPLWIGPTLAMGGAVTVLEADRPLMARLRRFLVATLPIALIVVLYVVGRSGMLGMAGASGGAPRPRVDDYGLGFIVLSGIGLLLAASRRETRTTPLFAAGILAQSVALLGVSMLRGSAEPYMPLKMFYLLLYPQAAAAALSVAGLWRLGASAAAAFGRASGRQWRASWLEPVLAALLIVCVGVSVTGPLRGAPRTLSHYKAPAMSLTLERAGRWAKENLPVGCIEYLVASDETAYWLHLAVLGNPRHDLRAIDPDTYRPGPATIRWLTPGGLPYAIADLDAVNRDIREDFDVLAQFGRSAVVRRRGDASCPAER